MEKKKQRIYLGTIFSLFIFPPTFISTSNDLLINSHQYYGKYNETRRAVIIYVKTIDLTEKPGNDLYQNERGLILKQLIESKLIIIIMIIHHPRYQNENNNKSIQ